MKKLPVLIGVAAGALIFLSSCLKNNGSNTNPQQSYFLLANVSPGSPGLSVTVNGNTLVQGLRYSTYSASYYYASAGTYDFSFYNPSSSTPVLTNNVTLSPSTTYSYFLVDSFSKIKASIVKDVFPNLNADSSYIRFFNFSPNSGSLVLRDSVSKDTLYINRTFNDQNNAQTYSSFGRIKSGNYTFQLQSTDGAVKASKPYALSGGHVYTFFAKGLLNATDSSALGLGQIQNY